MFVIAAIIIIISIISITSISVFVTKPFHVDMQRTPSTSSQLHTLHCVDIAQFH